MDDLKTIIQCIHRPGPVTIRAEKYISREIVPYYQRSNDVMEDKLSIAIYARVSSQRLGEDLTIQSHLAALKKRIQDDGLCLNEELCFLDEGLRILSHHFMVSVTRSAASWCAQCSALGIVTSV